MADQSKGHLGFTKSADGRNMEVFHAGAASWRNVVWASLDCTLDTRTGYRCGGRPAPFDVVKDFASAFPWK